ncbi:MAG: aldehyde dehydrogenase [Bacteroidetes bacterium]|nr:aldehyde dehydrogenase [Bacteroidota bacterium]
MSKVTKDKNQKRLEILKTYKIYIGGKFPRTESGRYYNPVDSKGNILGNICLSSRKDFRNAAVAARSASGGWSARTSFNRSQILYRLGEMLEGRRAQFIEELKLQGSTFANAEKEVNTAIDRLIHYAGWCDKYQQIFSSVNPVSESYFNFSVCEPMGVVAIIAPEENSLLGLVSVIAPVIAGGNTCIVLASERKPLCAVTFAEVINSSDVPGGVINILTGNAKELSSHFSSHMDVNAIVYSRTNKEELKKIQINATENMKRVIHWSSNWFSDKDQDPYMIRDIQEIKTTWHPIEQIGGSGTGY